MSRKVPGCDIVRRGRQLTPLKEKPPESLVANRSEDAGRRLPDQGQAHEAPRCDAVYQELERQGVNGPDG
jgi:hypothetical protein